MTIINKPTVILDQNLHSTPTETATTDSASDLPPSHPIPPQRMPTSSNFERGGMWMSSFRGDTYIQEDIYKVTDHVRVGFDDIFGEPFALRTGDIGSALSPHVRKIFNHIFSYTQAALYFFLTLLTGMFLGLAWGIVFGLLNYVIVWFVQPSLKLLFILLRIVAMPTKALVRAFMDPIFQAFGQVFSFISAKFRLKVVGLEGGREDGYGGKRTPSKCYSNASSYPQEWLGFV